MTDELHELLARLKKLRQERYACTAQIKEYYKRIEANRQISLNLTRKINDHLASLAQIRKQR